MTLPLAYTYGQGLALAAVVAFLAAWGIASVSVIRRGDLGIAAKALWMGAMLVLPIVGMLVYYLWQAASPDRSRA
ncbi:MAG: PLD nuclease N-terminal domain-containing protein [Gaiellaceae bacterium]|nr:PLD nuclease N-terminal domain-containing protein [Gaiellaceae bacterium]